MPRRPAEEDWDRGWPAIDTGPARVRRLVQVLQGESTAETEPWWKPEPAAAIVQFEKQTPRAPRICPLARHRSRSARASSDRAGSRRSEAASGSRPEPAHP